MSASNGIDLKETPDAAAERGYGTAILDKPTTAEFMQAMFAVARGPVVV